MLHKLDAGPSLVCDSGKGIPIAAFAAEIDSFHEARLVEKQVQEPSEGQSGIEGQGELRFADVH